MGFLKMSSVLVLAVLGVMLRPGQITANVLLGAETVESATSGLDEQSTANLDLDEWDDWDDSDDLSESLAVTAGCTISSLNDVARVIAACTNINVGSFSVPAANQPLIMQLQTGTILTFTGTIDFEKNPNKNAYMIEIMGQRITVSGTKNHLFHGHGELYWDGLGGAGSPKPTFMYIKAWGRSRFTGLHLKNCPMRCVAVDGSRHLIMSRFFIDNREGKPGVAPAGKEGHNTDGFDVDKSSQVTIRKSTVFNQDDCVAINGGADITIDELICEDSHGFDIATGLILNDVKRNTVSDIIFRNSILNNPLYGLHILTVNDGGPGMISRITYDNVTFTGAIDYGIMIQQDFSNAKQGTTPDQKGNIPIDTVTFKGITGTMNGKYSSAVTIRCAAGACKGITFEGVSITGAKANNECINYSVPGFC